MNRNIHNFKGTDCTIQQDIYPSTENLAITLVDLEGYVMCRATINGPHPLARDLAYIKDYSENAGMLTFLQNIGIVKKVLAHHVMGYVEVPLCVIDLEMLK